LWIKGGNNKVFYLGTLFPRYTFTMPELQVLKLTPNKNMRILILYLIVTLISGQFHQHFTLAFFADILSSKSHKAKL